MFPLFRVVCFSVPGEMRGILTGSIQALCYLVLRMAVCVTRLRPGLPESWSHLTPLCDRRKESIFPIAS